MFGRYNFKTACDQVQKDIKDMEPIIESGLEAIKDFVGQEKVQRALAITNIYLPYILVSLIAFPLASHAALRASAIS